MIELEELTKFNIKEGITLHYLRADKFKTNVIGILIRNELTKENATKNAVLAQVLKKSCDKYPTSYELVRRTEEMFGSVFNVSVLKKGEEQILFFYMEVLANSKVFEEGLEFLREIISKPLIKENGFDKETVEREKENLRQKIRARSDDKKEYAKLRCIEETCSNEAFGVYGDGYEEDIDSIDCNNLYDHYIDMLKHSPIEIMVCGTQSYNTENIIKKMFIQDRQNIINLKPTISEKRNNEKNEVKEKMDILQGKLCMSFRSSSESKGKGFFGMLVFNEILGAGSNSRLFNNVREKESLCYYVNSFMYRYKMILVIQAGIEDKNYDKTVKIILDEIESLKSNLVTEKEIENAKINLSRYYNGIEDYQSGIMDFYLNEYLIGSCENIKSFIEKINKVNVEDVRKAAESISVDTVYFLSGK